MKVNFAGVPARMKRRIRLVQTAVLMLMITATTTLSASPSSGIVPVAQCYPSNDILVGPLKPLAQKLVGAMGGLIPILASALIVAAIIWGLFKVWRQENIATIFKVLLSIPLVAIAGPLIVLFFGLFYGLVLSSCKTPMF